MSRPGAWLRVTGVAGIVVLADQASKQIAISGLAERPPVRLPLGFELDYVTNTGIAFGLFEDGTGAVTAVTVLALALLLGWFAFDPLRPALWVAVGLLSGGALGNLADRVRDGAVIDFLDPPLWPAFNLADVAITAGVVLLLITYTRPSENAGGAES